MIPSFPAPDGASDEGGNVSIAVRVKALRAEMRRAGLAAYVVPSTDPHQSEYTPAYWQRRQWLSGFTGSVGDLAITRSEAFLWVDSRYHLQAEEQLAGTPFAVQKLGLPGVPSLYDWLAGALKKGDAVGIDPQLVSLHGLEELERAVARAGGTVKLVARNLVDAIWGAERPAPPSSPIDLHPTRFAGESAASKLARVRELMAKDGAEALVVTSLDSVAWLYNVRGRDVDYNPVVVASALVTPDQALLFVDEPKVPALVARALEPLVEVRPYGALGAELGALGKARRRVWVDPATATASIGRALKGAALHRAPSPIPALKARKNATELRGARAAHLRDGVAMVRFLHWLEDAVVEKTVTELSAAAALEGFRAELDRYRGPSFTTISATADHGAIVHYGPTPESDRRLRPRGLYLVDSGGQYLDGTTDITRTVLLGGAGAKATAEQRDRFTRVLKGHIRLALARFPAGVTGQRLDAFARAALWEAGLDYGHGTGHGVGSYLSVHEAPPGVAPARLLTAPLEEGHVLSNEPGVYLAGRWGIRTENLMVVVRDAALSRKGGQCFLRFETLTLCPIDARLIEPGLLEDRERRWLDDYHATVARALAPHLDRAAAAWLKRATRPLK
jgi:Xaa-Pro aminopeptidase